MARFSGERDTGVRFAGEKTNLSLLRGAGTANRSVSRVPTIRSVGRTDGFAMVPILRQSRSIPRYAANWFLADVEYGIPEGCDWFVLIQSPG